MKILYGFSNCSYKKFDALFADASVMILQQAQKYHSLMTAGLTANGADVQCISGLPVNRELDQSLYIYGGNDEENGVRYHYFGSINLPGFRQICLIMKSFLYTLFAKGKDAAICDVLNVSIVVGMLAACKIRHIPIVGVVTDVPGKLSSYDKRNLSAKVNARIMQRMDGYVFLTEMMNGIVNPHNVPYVVIEGQVDTKMQGSDNAHSLKSVPKILLYAGSLKKIYGISRLVEAFVSIEMSDWELDIYGDGDYKDELLVMCDKYANVKYRGIKPNAEIFEAEISASLLVNPRPTDEEYTQYSFPSKNMEYMASGTPVLTTLLPGMPKEYLDNVYLIQDETMAGISNVLRLVLNLPPEELHRMGVKAKKFVMDEKNNVIQASKVIRLLKNLE